MIQLLSVAQTCSINGPDEVCLGSLAGFSFSSSQVPTAVNWTFGDGNTSLLNDPFHLYAIDGSFTISLVLTFADNSTCRQTKNINIYPLPIADFVVNNTSLCLPRAEVCLEDQSTASDPSRPLQKKLILWGDGDADSFNYPGTKKHCYSYLTQASDLPLLLEVVDSKGCKSQDSVKINVFTGISSFDFHHDVRFDCGNNELCFCNTSVFDSTIGMKFKWIFNGVEEADNNTDFNSLTGTCAARNCFTQTTAGNQKVQFVYENNFGCKDTLEKNYNYKISNFTPSMQKSVDTICRMEMVNFTAVDAPNRSHFWRFESEGESILLSGNNVFNRSPPGMGKWKMRYRAVQNGCEKILFDSVEVRGPTAELDAKNTIQCNVNDTVYFVDESRTYMNGPILRLWSFNDPNAPQCTTNTSAGINVGKNCNFSLDSCAKHYYSKPQCYSAKLFLKDSLYGCEDSVFATVFHTSLPPYNNEFSIQKSNPVFCEGEAVVISSALEDCSWGTAGILIDSADMTVNWESFKLRYQAVLPVNPDGWVTIGIIRQLGSPSRFSGPKGDTLQVDPSAVCTDTIWLHNFYRVIPQPKVEPVIKSIENCEPFEVIIELKEKPLINVARYIIDWGDGNRFEDTLPNFNFPDSFVHTYKDGLKNFIVVAIEGESGCFGSGVVEIRHGVNSSFDFYKGAYTQPAPLEDRSKLVCIGDTLTFQDSVFYAGSFTSRWRTDNVPEVLEWDFDDGSPRKVATFPVYHVYNSPGTFNVRMIATDSFGCKDTVTRIVLVPEVVAGIKSINADIRCGAITQLFDSTSLSNNYLFDSISKHFWMFGDGGPPSLIKNPFRNYPKPGAFNVFHVAENTYGCRDTATITLTVQGPEPFFEILSDTVACPNHLVVFDNQSSNASSFIWDFGNTANNIFSTNIDSNVSYEYQSPGLYNIYLTAIDSIFDPFTGQYNFCSATFPDSTLANPPLRRIRVLPKRKADFNLPDTVCANKEAIFADNSDPIYTNFNWRIDPIGDNINSTNPQNTYRFSQEGNYQVIYTPTYIPALPQEPACLDSSVKNITVVGFSTGFDYKFKEECGLYEFRDTSDNSVISYQWNFGQPSAGDKNNSFEKSPSHQYGGDAGTFRVCVAVESKFGCTDTICKNVTNTFYIKAALYNVFTPNNDGINDAYDIDITNELEYQISIFNRYGTLVYQGSTDGTANDGENWNGKLRNTGASCAEGSYFYQFKYKLKCSDSDEQLVKTGIISLFR